MSFQFQNMRVAARMRLLSMMAMLGLIIICATSLYELKHSMMEDRQKKTTNLVETAAGILNHYHQRFKSGSISEDEAKSQAREALRNLRFDTDNYFFILDTDHNYVLFPSKPEREGTNQADMKDANGVFLIRDIVSKGKQGGGFVSYHFPKAGQTVPEPKLSYVTLFGPWNWVVGTGIYVDDVNRSFNQQATLLGGIALVLLALLSLFGWAISSSILRQLGGEPTEAMRIMQNVASGDLTQRVSSSAPGSLLHSLGEMVSALRNVVSEIEQRANQLVAHAESIASASEQISRAAEEESEATASMAAAIEQLTVSSNHISDSAHESARDSNDAVALSNQGTQRVSQATQAILKISDTVSNASSRIRALEERAGQVSSIANVIKDIAGQTNLLALNAAIEAARAGEQGRGFAVVADEVRKLAERTSTATTEIEQMLAAIQIDTSGAVSAMDAALPEVEEGVQLANSASESLQSIAAGANRTLERIGEVANATREQSSTSTSIAQRVEQIANRVEQTCSTMRGTTQSAHELEAIANNLKSLIGRFRA